MQKVNYLTYWTEIIVTYIKLLQLWLYSAWGNKCSSCELWLWLVFSAVYIIIMWDWLFVSTSWSWKCIFACLFLIIPIVDQKEQQIDVFALSGQTLTDQLGRTISLSQILLSQAESIILHPTGVRRHIGIFLTQPIIISFLLYLISQCKSLCELFW